MNNEQVIRDLSRKYVGTYFRIPDPKTQGNSLVVLCSNVAGGGRHSRGSVVVTTPRLGELIYHIPGTVSFDLSMPQTGTFQNGDVALIFSRLANRQWRRGVCRDNSHIQHCWDGLGGLSYTHSLLEKAYEHQQFTLDEAMDLFRRRPSTLSVAIKGNYIVSRVPYSKSRFAVFYKNRFLIVGKFKYQEGTSRLMFVPQAKGFASPYQQQLFSFFERAYL
jgi:hypothetical protein